MSYHDVTPSEYSPKQLAEEIHIKDEIEQDEHPLLALADALELVQELSGDDSMKWFAVQRIVEAMNQIDPNAEISVTDDSITVDKVMQ